MPGLESHLLQHIGLLNQKGVRPFIVTVLTQLGTAKKCSDSLCTSGSGIRAGQFVEAHKLSEDSVN